MRLHVGDQVQTKVLIIDDICQSKERWEVCTNEENDGLLQARAYAEMR